MRIPFDTQGIKSGGRDFLMELEGDSHWPSRGCPPAGGGRDPHRHL